MHCLTVPEVVRDDVVDVGEHQGVAGANDVFRRHAVLVLLDKKVEADTAFADARVACLVYSERSGSDLLELTPFRAV
jgi:hypothetical protein